MAFRMPHMLVVVSTGALLLALIFQLVGIAGPAWFVADDGGAGLFRSCATVFGETICTSTPSSVPGWWKASEALSILGLVAIVGALALGVVHFFQEDTARLSRIAASCSGIAGACLAAETGLFTGKNSDTLDIPGVSLGYSFVLTLIACLACYASLVMFFIARRMA